MPFFLPVKLIDSQVCCILLRDTAGGRAGASWQVTGLYGIYCRDADAVYIHSPGKHEWGRSAVCSFLCRANYVVVRVSPSPGWMSPSSWAMKASMGYHHWLHLGASS